MSAKALVIAGYGLNCEEETAFAFRHVGFDTAIRHINDLAETPEELANIQALAIPGGFSYGDDTGSGNAFAQKMRLTLRDHLIDYVQRDTLTIGVCNGCQIAANLGLAPALDHQYGTRQIAVTHNESARYQCRWIDVAKQDSQSPWLDGVTKMHIPVAHGEGRFMMDDATLKALQDKNQIALRYVDAQGNAAKGTFPANPNGSTDDIAAITDPSGRVLIIMPHPERGMLSTQRNDYAALKDRARRGGYALPDEADGMRVFDNAARYFDAQVARKAD